MSSPRFAFPLAALFLLACAPSIDSGEGATESTHGTGGAGGSTGTQVAESVGPTTSISTYATTGGYGGTSAIATNASSGGYGGTSSVSTYATTGGTSSVSTYATTGGYGGTSSVSTYATTGGYGGQGGSPVTTVSSSSTGGGGPSYCGGDVGLSCPDPENQFCKFQPNGSCGWADGGGVCRHRPQSCPAPTGQSVCACNGITYPSRCLAAQAGFDTTQPAACLYDGGSFACGDYVCGADQFCESSYGTSWRCVDLPTNCAACGCIQEDCAVVGCSADAAGHVTVSCEYYPD